MKMGFSLAPSILRGTPRNEAEERLLHHCGSPEELLERLRKHGIESIELRYVYREEKQDVAPLFRLIWEQGLEVTVHGRIEGDLEGPSFIDHYPSLSYALQHYRQYQDQLVMTLHAYHAMKEPEVSVDQLTEKTVRLLQTWLKQIEEQQLDLYLAIELTRRIPDKTDPGSQVDTLLQLVRQAGDDARCGICWDMGHYYSNALRERQVTELPASPLNVMPPREFLERTLHTHIHGLSERCRTHFPMTAPESLPLERYVQALREAGYSGVLNLELDFPRYADQPDFIAASFATIERLRQSDQS